MYFSMISNKNAAYTGKSLSEVLIFASIKPQYDNRLFMELPWKRQAQNMGRTCSAHVLSMFCTCGLHDNSMNNHFPYCGLVDATISEKDLPVVAVVFSYTFNFKNIHLKIFSNPKYNLERDLPVCISA